MESYAKQKKQALKTKQQTAKQKEMKLAPIEASLNNCRLMVMMLLQIKNTKIPFYEKLPKDN